MNPEEELLEWDGRPTPPIAHRALRVLLAEDDDGMRDLVASALRGDGHEVIEASDGRELVARIGPGQDGARSYDVVVSDVMMPGATGITVLWRLAHVEAPPAIVVMTAFGGSDMLAWSRSIGAVAMFDKPFDVDDLRTVLMNLPPRPLLVPPDDLY